jgi:hypothetical protein
MEDKCFIDTGARNCVVRFSECKSDHIISKEIPEPSRRLYDNPQNEVTCGEGKP